MKKSPLNFWLSFIVLSAIFLFCWFVFWQVKNHGLTGLKAFVGILPVQEETKTDLQTVAYLYDALMQADNEERVFLILLQNNLELRPGGGFIGSFGILKIRNGAVTGFAVHDTGNFDGRIPDIVTPPYPMHETLNINSWKLRDSNYSPDFGENAKWAQNFYSLGQGEEQFDGIVAVTGNVLTSLLNVTGPIEIKDYPLKKYDANNALADLEYQVEKGYRDQAIAFGERKSFMGNLGLEMLSHIKDFSVVKKYELFWAVMNDLHSKDIQIIFKNPRWQRAVARAGWNGAMNSDWNDDFLFLVDANLNAFKTDYYVHRSYTYQIDLTKDIPQAHLSVTYKNIGSKRDWFAKDYQTFLRVYVPQGGYLKTVSEATTEPVFGEFKGKKYFGVLVQVPIMSEKTVTFDYQLPRDLEQTWYDLMIQKQPGLSDVPVKIDIIHQDGTREEKSFILKHDTLLSEIK